MKHRLASLLLGSALLCPLAGCSDDTPSTPAPPAGPTSTLDFPIEQRGPYRVGHRTLTTSYQPPGGLPARTLTVHLWYPTLDTEGDPVKYLIFPDKEALENASLAPPVEATGYPVHVHSHGMWGFAGNSAGVMRWFASHGWIAAAPDHAGNTLPEQTSAGIPLRLYYLRPLDIRATLDALETLPPADPLAGKARTARVSMSGHSFGSHSTWAILGARYDANEVQAQCDKGERFSEPCQASDLQAVTGDLGDPRVVAAVPMAGAPLSWFGASLGSVQKPVQQQSAAGDPVGADKLWEQTDLPGFTWVEFAGGCHQLFGLGGCPGYEDEEGFRLVSVLTLALARRHVLGDDQATTSDLLTGKRSLSDKISFRIKESTP